MNDFPKNPIKQLPLQDLLARKQRQTCKRLLYQLNIKEYVTSKATKKILRDLLPNAAMDLYIEPPFFCDYGTNIFCGNQVFINVNCTFLDTEKITIGNNVFIGPNVQIYTSGHPIDPTQRHLHQTASPVNIGNDTWIGGQVVICPGINIGNNVIVAAGAVVTKSFPDNVMIAGNPAKIIKDLPSL